MDGESGSQEMLWKARRLSRVCARWLRKTGKPLDALQRRELEADLLFLLAKYRDEWSIQVVGLPVDPAAVKLRRPPRGVRPE